MKKVHLLFEFISIYSIDRKIDKFDDIQQQQQQIKKKRKRWLSAIFFTSYENHEIKGFKFEINDI